MRKVCGLVLAIVAFVSFAVTTNAMDKNLDESDAVLHEFVADAPSGVQVAVPYRKAINLHRLNKKELAYWNPHNDKYIVDGKYSYLWCVVYKNNNMNPKHHWIAIDSTALDRAFDLNHEFAGGVAFYQLRLDGKKMAFKAFPYTTLHSMMEGKKLTTIKE